jgi:hypothetical protein
VLRSLLSEPAVRATLRAHFVCTWVLKDDLARDIQHARARASSDEEARRGGGVPEEGRLASSLLRASRELAQILVLSPTGTQFTSFTGTKVQMLTQMFVLSLTPPAFEAAVVGGGEEEEQEVEQEQEGFLRVYTETGPYAAFDRY